MLPMVVLLLLFSLRFFLLHNSSIITFIKNYFNFYADFILSLVLIFFNNHSHSFLFSVYFIVSKNYHIF